MKRPIAIALLAIGVVVFVLGLFASHAVNARVAHPRTNHIGDAAIWALVLGASSVVAGLAMVSMRRHP